jgi:hypothetical protein
MNRISRKLVALPLAAVLAVALTVTAFAAPRHHAKEPVKVTVFSPGPGDHSGRGGVGFIVDVSLDATSRRPTACCRRLRLQAVLQRPRCAHVHPGPNPGAPGLVVLLSSTPTKSGTPFHGPRTNLAGLFQINGVAKVRGLAETWNTWQPGKPLFGLNKHVRLTVYVVRGTAPALVPAHGLHIISNTVNVPFTIAG